MRKLQTLFSLLLLLPMLNGCNKEDLQTELANETPGLQAEYSEYSVYHPGGPCEGMASYALSYSLLPPAEFPGYDLAIQAIPSVISPPDANCECKEIRFCVTLAFPQNIVFAAGLKRHRQSPTVQFVAKDQHGGYVNHNDPRRAPGTTLVEHVICTTEEDGMVVLFDLDYGFPPGFNLMDAIVDVEGICLVDDISDPNG